jgi:hypothetical protein
MSNHVIYKTGSLYILDRVLAWRIARRVKISYLSIRGAFTVEDDSLKLPVLDQSQSTRCGDHGKGSATLGKLAGRWKPTAPYAARSYGANMPARQRIVNA